MISGWLGEVIKESRTLATHLNGNNPTETAVMEYRSDYLGRMQWIVYPDGEQIVYGYDRGGQVISVTGSNYGNEFNYVTNILYDQYGQRTRIDYGNGTFTEYNYDPARRWLDTIKTENKWGQAYQNISYSFDAVGNVLGYENDCLDSVTGNYMTKQTYSYDNLYQLIKADGETTYNPYQSSVPEFKSNYTQTFTFDSIGLGNMTSKVSSESVTPQKTIGDNLNYSFEYAYDENYAHRLVRAGDRYYKYDANGNIVCEQDGDFESGNDEETVYHKITQESENVYSTDYGWGLFKDDEKGGSGGKTSRTKYNRTYTWNERNQLVSSVDDNYSTAYVYGQDGQRSNKYTQNSETLYFNKMWTLHTDSGNNVYGGQTAKNIYLGETRIVTKLNSGENPTYHEEYYKQYYYHSDHLGSASLISDYKGDEYQRIEYTPYGETWVEKTSNTGLEYLPYKFTGKEIDEETGLYYYGARYLDPRYSRWISTDPALGEYIPAAGNGNSKNFERVPGMGGIYNTVNLQLYHYAGNNPIRFTDPDGRAQNVAQKIATSALKFISNHSKTARTFIKEHTSIQIQRSVDDNGQNGKYFQSKGSISFCGIPLNTIDVQSTADWKSQVDAGKGGTINAGTYTGTLLNKSGSYENAISITGNNVKESDAVLCHPNVKTALGETEEYGSGSAKGRPLSLGCQISHLEDFNEVTNILKDVGFEYGVGKDAWAKGDTIKINIAAPKED